MKRITKVGTWPDTWMEFTGAELKQFYKAHDQYFVCSAIRLEYTKQFGVEMHPPSESVILSIRQAVPNRFKKNPPESCKNVMGAWLLQKYATACNCRQRVIDLVPDDYVFTIPMYPTRQS
jgi:hypothetical protein